MLSTLDIAACFDERSVIRCRPLAPRSSIASSAASIRPRRTGAARNSPRRHPTDRCRSSPSTTLDHPVHAGWAMPQVLEELAAEARAALDHARTEAAPVHAFEAKLVEGDPASACSPRSNGVTRLSSSSAAMVTRAAGIALGAVSTHPLHEAPCSFWSPAARSTPSAGRDGSSSVSTGRPIPSAHSARRAHRAASTPSCTRPRRPRTPTSTWLRRVGWRPNWRSTTGARSTS